jgi:uncharacterized protein
MVNQKKYNQLIDKIQEFNKVAVAFSGGVDSSFLAAVAKQAVGVNNVLAITIKMPAIPLYVLDESMQIAKCLGIEHLIIEKDNIDEYLSSNPIDRCYYCKKDIYGTIIDVAKNRGFINILDGSNADDKKDYRPGSKAIQELNVFSPLAEFDFSKDEIREYSKMLNLPTWDKPAYSCLYTRFPYNSTITRESLIRLEHAEKFLFDKGFKNVRVRCHNDLARIEVPASEIERLLKQPLAVEIYNALKNYGFNYVTVDILGYRKGNYDQFIEMK